MRINPRGHRGRVGPRIIGDDEAFPLIKRSMILKVCLLGKCRRCARYVRRRDGESPLRRDDEPPVRWIND